MRGGIRSGAGRPVVRSAEKRVTMSCSVRPETIEGLKTLRERKVKIGRAVDLLVAELLITTKTE